ncbi:MAG: glycosyltransferase [Lachnospiraceae bacterium]|jgi:glycosyltransferase involved in cell wall biosynthesis|nr:glycosyltransferase [Lachnospiraceae bacterium]
MTLSIIVPIYNMATDGKLAYCLDSLLNQTIEDYEIIAVDDCSTDGMTPEVIADYCERYPKKITAIYSSVNKRQGGAKNIGLAVAKGEWISFIDADDWVTPDYYERLLYEADQIGADMAGCDYSFVECHTMETGRIAASNRIEQAGVLDQAKYRSLILDGGSLAMKIYRRHIIYDYPNRFPEKISYEDNAIGVSWMLRAKCFAYLPEPLYYYYQHPVSTTHIFTEARCRDRLTAARILIDEAREYGYYDEYLKELEYRFTELFYINTLFTYMRVKRPRLRFVKELGREMRVYFPRFTNNPYYNERQNAENKKLINIQLTSSLCFMVYFKILWGYRKLREKR